MIMQPKCACIGYLVSEMHVIWRVLTCFPCFLFAEKDELMAFLRQNDCAGKGCEVLKTKIFNEKKKMSQKLSELTN